MLGIDWWWNILCSIRGNVILGVGFLIKKDLGVNWVIVDIVWFVIVIYKICDIENMDCNNNIVMNKLIKCIFKVMLLMRRNMIFMFVILFGIFKLRLFFSYV